MLVRKNGMAEGVDAGDNRQNTRLVDVQGIFSEEWNYTMVSIGMGRAPVLRSP